MTRYVVRPSRRDLNVRLNVLLVALLIVSFISGWMASWLELSELGLHKYSSLAVFVVAFAHLALHWRAFANQLRPRPNTAAVRVLQTPVDLERAA